MRLLSHSISSLGVGRDRGEWGEGEGGGRRTTQGKRRSRCDRSTPPLTTQGPGLKLGGSAWKRVGFRYSTGGIQSASQPDRARGRSGEPQTTLRDGIPREGGVQTPLDSDSSRGGAGGAQCTDSYGTLPAYDTRKRPHSSPPPHYHCTIYIYI